MTRLPGHVKFALPLIFALCIIYASPVHAQSTLTDTRLQNGAAPLELPFFEDTTQTGSVQQAAVQFQRFGGSPDIFNVTKPLVVSGKGEMLWLHLDIANNSSTGSFVLSFAPQDKHGIAAVKAVRLFDPMQPNAPIAEWPSGADASSLPTLSLSLPHGMGVARYIQIETWPGLNATLLPLLKTTALQATENASQDKKTNLLLLLVGFVCGAGLIQFVLTRQALQLGLALNALMIGAAVYIAQHAPLLTQHGIATPLAISALFGIAAALLQILTGKSMGAKQSGATLVLLLNAAALAVVFVALPMLVGLGLPLDYAPHVLQGTSAALLLILTIVSASEQIMFAWFLPAWMALAVLPLVAPLYPFAAPAIYSVLLLIACVAAVFSYWQNMARETIALQRRLKQELKYLKEKHDAEGRDWQQKMDSERLLLNDMRAREQQRSVELDAARHEAENANKAKSDFLAIISHEIRTPMNGIMGIVQLMHQTPLNEKQLEYVDVIKNSGDTMLTLLNDILDYSKIEKGGIEIEHIPFTLRSLVQSVATLMSGRAKDKGLEITVDVGNDIPDHLLGDPNRVRQILLNLVSNAVKFTEKGGVTIKAELKRSDKRAADIHFSVIDTGMGIAPEVQAKLFQPYVQADASISRRFGGTGLGLNICRMLITAMKGEIGLDSTLGRGSTFWFDLTLEVAPDDIAIKTVSAEHYQPSRLLSVLAIDDNSINLKVVAGLLEMDGHSVTTSTRADEGIKLLQNKIFDLVFVDLMMPGMDGKSFALAVRQNPNQFIARTPLYALTGMSGDIAKQAVQSASLDGFLTKPVTQQALRATIESVAKTLAAQEKDPEMALKDILNKLGALAPVEREKLVRVLKEGSQGVRELYDAVRTEVKMGLASDELLPEEKLPPVPTEKPKVVPYLNYTTLNDLKNALPAATIDSLLTELIDKAKDLTDGIEEAKRLQDLEDLTEKAHNLKGMAGNFGLDAMMYLCEKIEKLGRDHHEPQAIALVPKLRPLLERTLSELDAWRKG